MRTQGQMIPTEPSACGHCCIRIEKMSVSLGKQLVLDNVNLHVNCREILAIVGPNGAGKSTLLKAMLGVVPYSGRIAWQIRGERREQRPRIGYVPQTLDFDRSAPVCVADFLASAVSRRPVWLGISGKDRGVIEKCLEAVSAAHLIDKRIGDLSGGSCSGFFCVWPSRRSPISFSSTSPCRGSTRPERSFSWASSESSGTPSMWRSSL